MASFHYPLRVFNTNHAPNITSLSCLYPRLYPSRLYPSRLERGPCFLSRPLFFSILRLFSCLCVDPTAMNEELRVSPVGDAFLNPDSLTTSPLLSQGLPLVAETVDYLCRLRGSPFRPSTCRIVCTDLLLDALIARHLSHAICRIQIRVPVLACRVLFCPSLALFLVLYPDAVSNSQINK